MIPVLPEYCKFVDATAGCVTTNGTVTSQYVSVKNYSMATLVLSFTQAVGHATTTTFQEATAVAGTGAQTIANVQNIWSNLATATNDTLIRRTDATSYALTAGVAKMQVVVQYNPMSLSAGFDCIGFSIATSSQATNFVSGIWLLWAKFSQATPPTAVVD